MTDTEINRNLLSPTEKILIVDTIRELRAYSRLPKLLKGQLEGVKVLMRKLREQGFTNADVSVIVGYRWKTPTIKRYTRGVKTVRTDERDKLLRLLSDLHALVFFSEHAIFKEQKYRREYFSSLRIIRS